MLLKVKIPHIKTTSYPIYIEDSINYCFKACLSEHLIGIHKLVIITDTRVKHLYLEQISQLLLADGLEILVLSMADGEQSKSQEVKSYLEQQMLLNHCDKQTLCIAIGGGVVGDMAGFIAATYMRGIKYIQIPTTLLAMVDSSVGGKTAINTPLAKNSIGVIYQPLAVLISLEFLTSLAKTQLVNGLVEAFKMFITNDSKAFFYGANKLKALLSGSSEVLKQIIHKALNIKSAIVSIDEKELHLRKVLNLGHTVGHALEQVFNYDILHGYAVALGIIIECKCAVNLGFLSEDDYNIIVKLFLNLGISHEMLFRVDLDELIRSMYLDKKSQNGTIHCVIINKIGEVYVNENKYTHEIPEEIIRLSFNQIINI